jgi:hypothetical protein
MHLLGRAEPMRGVTTYQTARCVKVVFRTTSVNDEQEAMPRCTALPSRRGAMQRARLSRETI